jgi:hypothetical protein
MVEEFCTTIEAAYDNMAHAHCMLDNQGYKNNIYVIFNAFPRQKCLQEHARTQAHNEET